jgi:hypothetical protein
LCRLRASKFVNHGKLGVRVYAYLICGLIEKDHFIRALLFIKIPATDHYILVVILNSCCLLVDWEKLLNLEYFPLLINRLLVQVQPFNADFAKGINYVALLNFSLIHKFAEANIFTLEGKSIYYSPILFLLKICLAGIK